MAHKPNLAPCLLLCSYVSYECFLHFLNCWQKSEDWYFVIYEHFMVFKVQDPEIKLCRSSTVLIYWLSKGFPAAMAKLSSCDRDYRACKVKNIYTLAFYKKFANFGLYPQLLKASTNSDNKLLAGWSCLTERHELTKLKPQVKSLGGRNRSEASFTKAIFQIVWKWRHFLID